MAGVSVEFTLEEKKAVQALSSIIKKLDEAGDSAKDNFTKAGKAFDTFKGVLGAELVIKGLEAAIDGAKELFNLFAVDGVKAAIAEEQALTRLATALGLSGDEAAAAKKDFADYANQIEETTGISDDLVLSNIALLKSLAPLTDKGLKEATKAAADLSSALGVDLETATRAVAAAANGNLSQLQKLTKQTFVEGKDNVETFTNALEQLANSNIAGAAVKNFQTFDGAIKAAGNSFDDFIKAFGRIIIENDAVKAAILLVADAFKQLEKFVDDNRQAISDFITGGANLLISAFKSVVAGIKDFASFISENGKDIKAYAEAFVIVAGVVGALVTPFLLFANAAKIAAIAQAALNVVVAANPFVLAGVAIAALVVGVKKLIDNFDLVIGTIQGFAASIINSMLPAINAVLDGIISIAKLGGSFGKGIAEAAQQAKDSIAGLSKSLQEQSQANLDAAAAAEAASNQETETVIANEDRKQKKRKETTDALVENNQKHVDLNALLNESLLAQETEFQAILDEFRAQSDQTNFQRLTDNLGKTEALQALSNAKKLQEQGKHEEAIKTLREANTKAAQRDLQSLFDFEKNTNAGRAANFKSTLGTIATLQSSNNETLFAIGKAAAIATATIDGIAATQKALASAPPPFNFVLAGIVGVASAVNIAKIASAQPPGRAAGGFVPGSPSPADNTLINAASGELILNRRQQTDLFNAINQNDFGNGGGGVVVNVQGNVIADDDSHVQELISRINDNVNFRNARLA